MRYLRGFVTIVRPFLWPDPPIEITCGFQVNWIADFARRAILPDPEKLSGASKWETWKLFIEAKLDLDSASLGNTPRAKFWTLYEANAKDWPDAVKISCLRAGLNDLLRKKLDYQRSVPSDYNDFVRTLHQLNSSSYGLLPGKSSGGKSNNNGGGGDPMDLSVIKGKYRTGKERMEAESDSDDDEHNYEGIHEVLAQVYA
ncbi:hypothetical protein V8F20_012865 [Naviculisporaceae sp. PSN 640]